MKIMRAWAVAAMAWVATAHGADEVFDRSEEIEKFVILFAGTASSGELAHASKELYVSGLSDRRLADTVLRRVQQSVELMAKFKAYNDDAALLVWGSKAIASFGITDLRPALDEIRRHPRVIPRVKDAIADDIDRIDWHRRKNEIMASTRNHRPGDDPRVSRYLNLILDEDFSCKYLAADRINWERLHEPRVLDPMAEQLVRYKDMKFPASPNAPVHKALGMYAKILGDSGNKKYRDALLAIRASKAGGFVRKHAKESLEALQ